MRTNEERLAALHRREVELEIEKRQRRLKLAQAVSVTVCLAAVILLALLIPQVSSGLNWETASEGMSASIFYNGRFLGYVVVGILAFLLGTSVTVFCLQLKKWQDEKLQEMKDRFE